MTSPFGIKLYLRIGEYRVYPLTRISQCIVTNVENDGTALRVWRQ
jgi:hypothetical protein